MEQLRCRGGLDKSGRLQPTQRGGGCRVGVADDTDIHLPGGKTGDCHEEILAQIDLPKINVQDSIDTEWDEVRPPEGPNCVTTQPYGRTVIDDEDVYFDQTGEETFEDKYR